MAVVLISVAPGIALGLIAGFARGIVEIAIMRLMDIILTLPSLLLAIVIVAILGPGPDERDAGVAVVVLAALRAHHARAVIAEVSRTT
jgi:dipeptide transport system permease protein